MIVDKTEEDYNKENREVIQKCIADDKNEKTIIAWGSCGEGNKRIQAYQKTVLEMLSDYQDKLFVIQDGRGKKGLHPLTPSVRSHWELVPFEVPNTEKQPIEQSTPLEQVIKETKHKETEVSENETQYTQQSEETAE